MKHGIQPDYHPVVFRDATTGHQFLTRSTATSTNTVEWTDGNTYPLIVVEISAYSHPWWTGTRRVLDAGRPGREVPPPLRRPHPAGKGGRLMTTPKGQTSRSNNRRRRADWKATAPGLVPIVADGERTLMPRALVGHFHAGGARRAT
jgi:large subunit ribosomal protein L31